MMETGKFKWSRWGGFIAGALVLTLGADFALSAGASKRHVRSHKKRVMKKSSRAMSSEPTPFATSLPGGIEVKISSGHAPDGSIVLMTVQLPKSSEESHSKLSGQLFSKDRDSGEPDHFKILFYPLEPRTKDSGAAYQAVIGVPFNAELGPTRIELKSGEGSAAKSFSIPFTVIDGDYPSEKFAVSDKFVNPSAEETARIEREQAELGQIYKAIRNEKIWKGPFTLPSTAEINGVFGTRRVFNGKMKSFHRGVDFRAKAGTPIYAAADGVVVLAKDLFYSGNTVILDHGYGIYTLYMHMSELSVKKDAQVKTGDVLGLVGATGRVTGPHLHWGVQIQNTKVNPLDLTKVLQ